MNGVMATPRVRGPAQKGTMHMPSTTTRSTMTIGDFLLRRLREACIAHLFGVAGDFNLEFLQQMEDSNEFLWVGNCNELNAAYAADGYARLNGISGLVVTNGVGAWSAINGVAGAYSEKVPIVCVCGSVPLKSLNRNLLMHHHVRRHRLRRRPARLRPGHRGAGPADAAERRRRDRQTHPHRLAAQAAGLHGAAFGHRLPGRSRSRRSR